VPALYVEVTAPDVAVLKLPALALDKTNVAVNTLLSISLPTMSIKSSGVSSVYDSAAAKFVALGGSFTGVTVSLIVSVEVETGVDPPVGPVKTVAPSMLPAWYRSQARNVRAAANVPFKFGIKGAQ
jgi:hypothetical protein